MTPPSVAVLGAGPSGSAAAKALLEYGLVPVEAGASLGGMWQGPGRGAWSDFAHTNISRYSCAFSDLAWSDDVEVFPLRRDLVHYLDLYADRYDVRRHIRFGTRVTAVRPVAGDRWCVDWRASADNGSAVFANVLVGSGFFSVPFRPLPGLTDFSGDVLHSADADPWRRCAPDALESVCSWWAHRSLEPKSPANLPLAHASL